MSDKLDEIAKRVAEGWVEVWEQDELRAEIRAALDEARREDRAEIERLEKWVSHASTECTLDECVCGRLDARSKP